MTDSIEKINNLIEKYTYQVHWDADDAIFVAQVSEFPSLAAHGDSHAQALAELKFVLAAVVEELLDNHSEIPEPLSLKKFSGRFNVRIPVELHRRLAVHAAQQGVSLNQLVLHKLSR